ncbi:MetQ/NlpA family ABC transporter substrate-binding protein [Parasaccharibacter sp. TMW 2.1891]|uniref:MetQ/NlpA family ABC transporter substrate-binding protein n=1 Tax=Parasaccharibacter sp. TMW 2.1891 TaxID=2267836 RepID=UPI002011DDE7|nr:MetQ/NlpA family ABC transporter substrate-binding protein [Parasaccharibacter sp. TMW 2.1891]MCL1512675.1 MetQ/NlpA family ABC transporter substrate-binding protein [Parasaccharibacter sp. TMW 2.1891]
MSRFSHLPRRRFLGLSAGLAGAAALGLAHPGIARADGRTLKIGIMSGEDEDIWRLVSQNAAQRGLTLKIIPFSDYNTPNEALSEHDVDANAFQHRPFLDAQIKAHGYRIVPVGDTYFQPIGLYSHKWHSVAEIPQNARIGIPNDPSNEGRALHVLETLGLIRLPADSGLFPTALDVTDNPRNISIEELDAGVVGRSLPDLDAAVVNMDWARKAGITEQDRIGVEGLKNNPYVNFISVNEGDANAEWVKPLVESYHQPNVHKLILDIYHGTVTPAWP